MTITSPFLTPGPSANEDSLSILHLRRDHSVPIILSTKTHPGIDTGYAEGNVVNTRFGSFPHTTLVSQPWGSQVRASKVDTGSRGRGGKKRKREADEDGAGAGLKEAITAASGFLHIFPPTPENWTYSLPHRTQVVYTPDYSYILHRIRARPGGVLIEAGSGSGSFTHASIRAVFNGYPDEEKVPSSMEVTEPLKAPKDKYGHVFTYEYHAERFRKVREETIEHGLSNLVTPTHRDVYNDGFLLDPEASGDDSIETTRTSPAANAIFLDLPAPWKALPHLTRQSTVHLPSPLDPTSTVHICTFSPCIEQAQRTVSSLRRYGWIDIEMVEMSQNRIDVRREYTGFEFEGIRGANGLPATVEDAVERLKQIEERGKLWRGYGTKNDDKDPVDEDEEVTKLRESLRVPTESERRQVLKIREKTLYKQGKSIHRSEPELKTHTSYLVFAILPREWSEEDESKMREKWSEANPLVNQSEQGKQQKGKSKKQAKREARQRREERKEQAKKDGGNEGANGNDHEKSDVDMTEDGGVEKE
ncbi:putative trna methyltransferase subunit [Phaeomoniella chlamydospora]|uniref:tRNA (adenine(58)-N(1))-methyltransferase catalytic subunit TRM61 n=1 Tax=Phaeomoniella chlamydospora TaxID=158046 RepID=A0A0G2EPD8_PHACM|nr:putative trna methyltransferase subunit [Phaeomoniella chlamydospora]